MGKNEKQDISKLKIRSGTQIAQNLEKCLVERNMSRQQFCCIAGVPNTTISKWKICNSTPSMQAIARIALALGVSTDSLIFDGYQGK